MQTCWMECHREIGEELECVCSQNGTCPLSKALYRACVRKNFDPSFEMREEAEEFERSFDQYVFD